MIMTARGAQIVRPAEFAAIGTLLERRHGQRIVRPAHVALGWRGFSFGNGHGGMNLLDQVANRGRSGWRGQTGRVRVVAKRVAITDAGRVARRAELSKYTKVHGQVGVFDDRAAERHESTSW